MKKLLVSFISLAFIIPTVGCNQKKDYFTLWNDCASLTKLKAFVEDVTNKNSPNYIPVNDRIATFDMDGTFIAELYPTYFEYNMIVYRAFDDPTYTEKDDYVIQTAQNIIDHCKDGVDYLPYDETHGFDIRHAWAAAKAYSGMRLDEFDAYVKAFAQKTPDGFEGMTYATSFYKPMLEVFKYLEAYDFTYYVVSGSDRLICRALCDSIGIEPNRVIGMDDMVKASGQGDQDAVNYTYVASDYLVRDAELIIKNLKTNKVKQIQQEIGKVPVLSFGNSDGDSAMHNYCKQNPKYKSEVFMLLADDDAEDHTNPTETAKRKGMWEAANYNIISMNNDFKTVYGYDVQKVDFHW